MPLKVIPEFSLKQLVASKPETVPCMFADRLQENSFVLDHLQ